MFETPAFDIDSLPDMEEVPIGQYVDLNRETDTAEAVYRNDNYTIYPNESYFSKCEYVRDKQKLWLQFTINPEDLKKITMMTGGLISADVSEGDYCFDIESNPNGSEDIYYENEYIGQYVDNAPRVYKRFFIYAVIHVMTKQNIILEYEPGQYTIHPDFLSGLDKVTQGILIGAFKKKGNLAVNREKLAAITHAKI